MSITLQLGNIDANATGVNIYRSVNVPTQVASLGAPVASVAPTETTWTDTAVENYNVYHYRIEVTDGVNRTLSENQMVGYYPDSGPGNNTVRRGDWVSGWMDELTTDQFISGADLLQLITALGLTLTAPVPNNITAWNKVVYRGKVLMVPNNHLGQVSWISLYNAGLVYGTNDGGTRPSVSGISADVNQRRTVQIRGNTYIVRTLRGATEPTSQYLTSAMALADTTSENYMVRVRLCDDGPNPGLAPRFSDIAPNNLNTHIANPLSVNIGLVTLAKGRFTTTTLSSTGAWIPILELAPGL